MATISTLAVNLIARTGVFERKMKKSRRSIMFFRNQTRLARRAVLRFGVGLLAVAGIGGLGFMIARSMKAIDATAKLAASLQISTEALKGLELAAKISGAELTTITKGIEIMVRRLGEAKMGIGEAKRGLDAMGLSAEKLIEVGTEEAFKQIAEEISKIPSAADKAFAAYTTFGRQGVKLLNVFKDGRAGIEAFRKEAEKLGLTFNAIDASKVEAANDAIVRARAVIEGLITKITVELAPVIEAMAMNFVNVATEGEGMGHAITGAFEAVAISIAKATDNLKDFSAKAKKAFIQFFNFKAEFAPGVRVAEISLIDTDKLGTAEQEVRSFFDKIRADSAVLRAKMEADAVARAEAIVGRAEFEREFAKFELLMTSANRIFEMTRTPLEKYEAQITKLNELVNAGAINWDTYGRAVRDAREKLEGVGGAFAGPGGARIIREAFVSVSGLALGTKDPTLSRMDQQLSETKQTNVILLQIRNEGGLS